MTAATATRRSTAKPAPRTAAPAAEALPTNLGELDAYLRRLRARQAQRDQAQANIDRMQAELETGEAKLDDIEQRERAALFDAIRSGKRDIDDATRRRFADERGAVANVLAGIPVDIDELPGLRAAAERETAALAAEWATARSLARALACQSIEQSACRALDAINDVRSTGVEAIEAWDNLKDLVEAWEAFRNSPAGRELIGHELTPAPDESGMVPTYLFGIGGRLADKLRVEALGKKMHALYGVSDKPDQGRVSSIVESITNSFGVPPFSTEERKLENAAYVSVAGRHALTHFRADPEQFRGYSRTLLEQRVSDIEAAEARLAEIRSQPF